MRFSLPHAFPVLLRAGRRTAGGLMNLVYPPQCLGCGARLRDPHAPLCARCMVRLERAAPEDVAARLARLPAARDVFDAAFALWIFDKGGALQRVQHALKYGSRPHLGHALGRLLGDAFRKGCPAEPELVLPVPLHRARRYERGYNQSAMLARGAAAVLGLPARTDLLRRTRFTRSQTALTRRKRWTNVAGAFEAPAPAALAGRSVLLIDDVLTTGTTAVAATRPLRAAGARVALATLALARS